jgi:DNA polymerase III delta prime subunit
MNTPNTIPWVEKYRPTKFDDIVLDPLNKRIMETIINNNYFPNLLLYGPPGTGKTTTIINLINSFQSKNNQKNKGLMIHLNASDERGIDIIRNQISQFVYSQSLFSTGTKFVILDEVDYMTKNAQHALKYLLQSYNNNVRFCLICNYISRIDDSLQNEFMRLRFNQLPDVDIIRFLTIISDKENIAISNDKLKSIQQLYKSDIRSMINYMQSNQYMMNDHKVIDHSVWQALTELIKLSPNINCSKNKNKNNDAIKMIETISSNYNIEIKNIIKDYLNYIIRNHSDYVTNEFLKFAEFIMHLEESNIDYIKKYLVITLHGLLNQTPL